MLFWQLSDAASELLGAVINDLRDNRSLCPVGKPNPSVGEVSPFVRLTFCSLWATDWIVIHRVYEREELYETAV